MIELSYLISDVLFKNSQVNDVNGTRRTSGNIRVCWTDWMDCQSQARGWKIIESERELLDSQCRFSPYDEHPNDWFRFPGYLQGRRLLHSLVSASARPTSVLQSVN